ncbi:HAMP domain-containing protein [Antrihabitans cavernicola]|uniref:histidine kinase n=2 Tax=Antrihabitans cavernicola TaxID=2495913 RepID=A0A5A7SAT6_9NOCA|nr:HAMP domain-containing protein [Spelaeibacter cavernicola]
MRSAVASALVVGLCLAIAGGALLFMLYRSLETSARTAADGRAQQVVEQLVNDPAEELDRSLFATDGQVGIVQVVDSNNKVVNESAGGETTPIVATLLAPSQSQFLGRVELTDADDFWVTGRGVQSRNGPVTVLVGADREPVENVVTTVALLLAVAGPVVVALVAVATYRLVGIALRPVERMRARVASISSSQLAERIPVPETRDEITRLAVTMNDMLARLESGQRAQQRFVSDASHELRSPLATITTALEFAETRPELLDGALIDESLLPEARRMRQLIEDLLILARADEHTSPLPTTDVDIDDILYLEGARIPNVSSLAVTTAIVPVRVTGDPRALARVVRNLVDNALRHARSEIHLECGTAGGVALIVVEDDGPGIPAAERDRVFDRFVRLDSPRTRESGGAGLGLAIVTEIVLAHHGTVRVVERAGGGSRFEVRLPWEQH